MSAAPSVSVVIPTFQRRRLVVEAVRSVLDQTHGDLEVIVVDDGSTDGTAAALGTIDARLKVVRRPHGGAAAARNTGIAQARAPVVAFLDSDDRWHAGHLEALLALLESDPAAVLACTGGATSGGDALERPAGLMHRPTTVLLGGVLFTSAVAVRRAAVEAVGGFHEPLRVTEDSDLWCRLSLEGPFVLGAVATVEAGEQPVSLRQEGRLAGIYPASRQRVCERFVERAFETAERRPLAETTRLASAGRGAAAWARATGALIAGELRRAEGELKSAWRHCPELVDHQGRFVRRLGRSHPRWHQPEEHASALAWVARVWPSALAPREELAGERV